MGIMFMETKNKDSFWNRFPIGCIWLIAILIAFMYLANGAQSNTSSGKIVSVNYNHVLAVFPGFSQWTAQYAYTGVDAITAEWTYNGNYSSKQIQASVGKNCTITTHWYTLQSMVCD